MSHGVCAAWSSTIERQAGYHSLSAGDTQYIIAESGQALSLQEDNDDRDQLWHGVGLLVPGEDSMGPAMARLFSDAPESPPAILIGDMTEGRQVQG